MGIPLVTEAYEMMMEKHGSELKKPDVYIHHDQGSQYLSTTFKQLLSDDGFIQSASGRGNSQDNAPMESFFSRLKADILDMVAMCRTFAAAKELVTGYLRAYNMKHYQYGLAGLTPHEFYYYATTGVYPLDSYFGVPASEMMAVDDLSRIRRAYADEEARRRRETAARRRIEKRLVSPEMIIIRDQILLKKKIGEWESAGQTASVQIKHLQGILEKATAAFDFIKSLTKEALNELREPLAWRKYEELSYVFAMNDLF